jgi:Dyp-type peroxidase family
MSRGDGAATIDLDDVQGVVVSGYGSLLGAAFLLLRVEKPAAARAWLRDLPVTNGARGGDTTAVNVALTFEGVVTLGVAPWWDFPVELREGMATSAARSQQLGDEGRNRPAEWRWGGPNTPPIHLLLALYAKDEPSARSLSALHRLHLAEHGLVEVKVLDSHALVVGKTFKEHFGFRDGLSQPVVRNDNRLLDPPSLLERGRPEDTVEAGEFLLGYRNEYGNLPESPTVAAESDPARWLGDVADHPGRRDLGRNGTYLVFRQIEQHVPAFWKFVSKHAGESSAERRRIAAKMVGRWPNGAPLVESDQQEGAEPTGNEFGYREKDSDGLRCPLGSHVRRSNPRDALPPDAATSIDLVKRHRLLRRGRPYGIPLDPNLDPEGMLQAPEKDEGRGLHFLCLNTSFSRQFEFVQHTWLNGPEIFGVDREVDPVAGASRFAAPRFTIQAEPMRRRLDGLVPFVTIRGGAYFFVPSLRAIRYLAALS